MVVELRLRALTVWVGHSCPTSEIQEDHRASRSSMRTLNLIRESKLGTSA